MRPVRRCFWIAFFTALIGGLAATADDYQPGKSYFGTKNYIEYLGGNLPVILSAPHGGRLQPAEMPDRDQGTFAFDTNTQELARAVAKELQQRTGGWPHVIICRLHRRKVDCNRELKEAAAGNPQAERAWNEFQNYIEAARAAVVKHHGRGLYIDLHGHGHAEQRLELGYLHGVTQLALDDAALNAAPHPQESSLRAISDLGKCSHAELIRGRHSFGALLEQHGFLCSPSPTNPHPVAPYFRGGYNTARHARDAAPLAGLQIETYSRGVRDTPENREKFSQALANALETFLSLHQGVGLVARPMAAEPAVPAVAK